MSAVVVLSEKLDSMAAPLLEKALEDTVDRDVVLDASGVNMLGGHCLEILVSGAKTAAFGGNRLEVTNPFEDFLRDLATLGLSLEIFDAPEDPK
ncbi:MAG: STAS domain-containing protein [Pseudomonadota bacterium]